MLRDVLTIVRREVAAYFNAPIAYVYCIVFLLVTCGLYMTSFFLAGVCSMRAFFASLPLLLVVFVPALTMRLWAEEQKSGTLALLFSLPISSATLCLSKFLAAFAFSALALSGTLTIPLMLGFLGTPDPGPILGGYLGGLCLLALLLALGMAISALFPDQIVAFILTLVIGFGSYLAGVDFIAMFLDGWVPGLGSFLKDGVGLSSHFASFAKGVVDLGDVLFFVSFAVIFIAINVLTLEGHLRLRAARGFALGMVLLLGIGLFLNGTVRNLRTPRFDLTAERLYTVTPATKRVLERLQVPIQVTYYVSSRDKLPTLMKDISRDVGDILSELAVLSPKFAYRIVDPAADPDGISNLERKGIVPFSAQTIEQDALDIKRVYSALSLAYLDKTEEVIPQVVPDSLGSLEYDLVSRIYRLTLKEKPKVVLVTPQRSVDDQTVRLLREMGRPLPPEDDYQILREMLQAEGYEVLSQDIEAGTPLPEDVRLLIFLAPGELNDRERYEVARFLRSGRPVLVAVQRFRYSYGEGPDGLNALAQKVPTNVDDVLGPYGLSVDEDMLFDQRHAILQIASRREMGLFTAMVQTPVKFPMQIQVLPDQMNQEVSITNYAAGLLYLWGSGLRLDEEKAAEAGLKTTILFRSSPASWTMPTHVGPLTEEDIEPPSPEEMESRPLAVLLEGLFSDPFAGMNPPPWPEEPTETHEGDETKSETGEKATSTTESPSHAPAPSRLLVVGCAEMFTDSVLSALGNAVFFLNSVDALALGEELIHIRAKSQAQRLLGPVSTEANLFWRVAVVLAVPGLWMAFGVMRALRRRRRREHCPAPVT